jgi:hypothetical protein
METAMDNNLPAASIEAVTSGLASVGYIASQQIATAVYLAERIEKPILVEGPAGVGKTELAKALAAWRGLKMIRMQCYEGLDEAKALYEWKYAKQLLYTQILKDKLGEVLGGAETLSARRSTGCTISATCSSPRNSSSRARCCRLWSSQRAACCWSTRSTSRTPNSNRCCSKSSPTTRSVSPSSEPSPRW